MGLDGYNAYRGDTPHALHDQQMQRRAEELMAARNPACDIVLVHDYDPQAQTVDVVLASDRKAQPLRGIPICGAGGDGTRWIRSWRCIRDGAERPSIGIILYPRSAVRKALDFLRRDANAAYARIERTAVFFGGLPAAASAGEIPLANYSATPALHQVGKGDDGIVKPSGAGFIVKEEDDLVLRGRKIYFLGLDQTEADAKPIGRDGDGAVLTVEASTVKVLSG